MLSFNSLNKGRQENMCGCNNCFCTNNLEPKQNSQLERRQKSFEHHHFQAVYPVKWPFEDMPFAQHLQRAQHVIKEPSLFLLLHSAYIASPGICSNQSVVTLSAFGFCLANCPSELTLTSAAQVPYRKKAFQVHLVIFLSFCFFHDMHTLILTVQ